MDIRSQILEYAQKLFFQLGVKAISVDDICGGICISKKTIYKYFESKDKIVAELIDNHIALNSKVCAGFKASTSDAIEELVAIYRYNLENHKLVNPIFISDIRKIYPVEWDRMQNFLNSSIHEVTTENIKRGQEEGLFRYDLNVDYVAFSYTHGIINMLEYFASQEKYSIGELNREYIINHIRGIGTEKALQKLNTIPF